MTQDTMQGNPSTATLAYAIDYGVPIGATIVCDLCRKSLIDCDAAAEKRYILGRAKAKELSATHAR